MGILKKGKKVNTSDRIKSGITSVAVGVGMSLVDALVGESDTINYGALVVGIGLPMIIPGTEKIGDDVAAIASYKTSKSMDVAGKLGLTATASTTGLGDRSALGNVNRMFQNKNNAQKKNSPMNGKPSSAEKTNPMG